MRHFTLLTFALGLGGSFAGLASGAPASAIPTPSSPSTLESFSNSTDPFDIARVPVSLVTTTGPYTFQILSTSPLVECQYATFTWQMGSETSFNMTISPDKDFSEEALGETSVGNTTWLVDYEAGTTVYLFVKGQTMYGSTAASKIEKGSDQSCIPKNHQSKKETKGQKIGKIFGYVWAGVVGSFILGVWISICCCD
ncbi:hypothetical protein T439DRAFT_326164 [Meredithblackwellia eburnea MCA 4105]